MQPPPPPSEPMEIARQVRKLRLEMRRLRYTVIICAVAICSISAFGRSAFGVWVTAALLITGLILLFYGILASARLLADGWDFFSMRWQRARWQAERNKPVDDNL